SEETRKEHDNIPWRSVVAMRNRLIHGYFDIDKDVVWNTLVNDLPPLIDNLAPLSE
ncbi:MAG: HepT-like ribonuclease domain-containing protein, partial [Thiohalospira sp.]